MKAKTEAERWYKEWRLERDIAWKEWRIAHPTNKNTNRNDTSRSVNR